MGFLVVTYIAIHSFNMTYNTAYHERMGNVTSLPLHILSEEGLLGHSAVILIVGLF